MLSTTFDEEEAIVVELRPSGDRYVWEEWLADRQGWVLVDAQVIHEGEGAEKKSMGFFWQIFSEICGKLCEISTKFIRNSENNTFVM